MKVLIVEDDALLRQGLVMALETEGYICDAVATGREAQASLAVGLYSLMILDLGLPDDDGLRLLSRLRRDRVKLPVLILTARDTIEDRIAGLDSGADDYLIKPFSLDELMARLRALIRRSLNQGDELVTAGTLELDLTHRRIRLEDRVLDLTPKEYAILARLILKAGNPVHREILHNDIYNWQSDPLTNALEVHIHNLRDKVGKSTIKTVRGFGYALVTPGEAG